MTNVNLRHNSSSRSKRTASRHPPDSRNPQDESRHPSGRAIGKFWRDNGLSLVLLTLFVIFLGGQTVAGWLHYNEELQEHQQSPIGMLEYVQSGAFGEAVFENWESEFLQMALYVVLTSSLTKANRRKAVPLIPKTRRWPHGKAALCLSFTAIHSPSCWGLFSSCPSQDTLSGGLAPTM
jgi:hypothetical protein